MKKSIDEIKQKLADLIERQKELQCLYKVNSILKEENLSFDNILYKIIMEIPNGYQFPEICKGMILIGDKEFKSPGLRITELMQSAKIRMQETEIGEIRVFYTKPVATAPGQVFLPEEQTLIDTIAESISQYITIQHFREIVREGQDFSVHLKIPSDLGKWLSNLKIDKDQTKELLTTRVNFRKGELILKQGAHTSYIVLLTDGLVKAYLEDINNRSFTFKVVRPYNFIGLTSIFGSSNYGFSATAIVPSSGYLIRKDIFHSIAEKNPGFSLRIFEWYCKNSDLLYHKLNCLGNKQAFGRIADTLLYLWEDIFDRKVIGKDITRKIIAEMSGMSNENGVRILSELKSEEIICLSKEGIEILKPEKLRTFVIVS